MLCNYVMLSFRIVFSTTSTDPIFNKYAKMYITDDTTHYRAPLQLGLIRLRDIDITNVYRQFFFSLKSET